MAKATQAQKRAFKKYRVRLVEAGLCQRCRQPRGEDGSVTYCRSCLDKQKQEIVRIHQRRMARGQCLRCARPARPGRTYCAICSAANTRRAREHYARKKAAAS